MKKVLAVIAMLAIPSLSIAGLVGDCYDCHTMHNSEAGQPVAMVDGALSTTPVANLLKLDCLSCHANDPVAGTKIWTLPGGSQVPQVAHGGAGGDLAGGNFSYGLTLGANASVSKVHNVKELFMAGTEDYTPAFGNPPGMALDNVAHNDIFTTPGGSAYDEFTCAGARGCHGTRAQDIGNGTGTANRVGMAAISGAHHVNGSGAKDDDGYLAAAAHSGATVAAGYRFIPGLRGYGNETDLWQNVDENSHNEYYGNPLGMDVTGTGCSTCHNFGAALTANMKVPNNSMSGFCSTCHGNFHSSSLDTNDIGNNGTGGAFLRHPSDYVIPNESEYQFYTVYNVSAPVARPVLATAVNAGVAAGTDMVMCLSCHQAHGSANDYILRFDYTTMTAGAYADQTETDGIGGCLACHTAKGVVQ